METITNLHDLHEEIQESIKEKRILNTDEPIFVYYINISGLPKVRAKELIMQTHEIFNYENVTLFVIPNEEKTELQWINNPYPQYIYNINEK